MKYLLFLLICIGCATANAQSIFKPVPLPSKEQKLKLSAAGATATLTQNVIRPLAGVSASIGNGGSLAGGIGLGLAHEKFDDASQSWLVQYSISALVFIDSNGKPLIGLPIGFANGLFQVGPGYNFSTKSLVLLTGVGIKF